MKSALAYSVDITWQNITGAIAGVTVAIGVVMKWMNVRKSMASQLKAQTEELKKHADQLYDGNRERELKQYERMFAQQEKIATQTAEIHRLEEARWDMQRKTMQGEIEALTAKVNALVIEQKKSSGKIEELHQLNEALQKPHARLQT